MPAQNDHVIVYADGGSRGNPGVAGSGAVVYAADGRTALRDIVYVVGKKASNNVAEYHGLLRGLEAARDLGARTVEVYMDSKLVVEQMSGRWKIKHPDMQKLALEARRLVEGFENVTFAWVPRGKNAVADALSNQAMDAAAAGAEPGIVGGKEAADPEPAAEPAPRPTGPAPRRVPPGSSSCATARPPCRRPSSTPATPTRSSPTSAASRRRPRPAP